MADVFNRKKRSEVMASITSKDTAIEVKFRKALHRKGFRYGLHNKSLPGKPDLVFRKYRAVAFIHGCFWHGHSCELYKLPATNTSYWKQKALRNQQRDQEMIDLLLAKGWRVMVVWECSMRGKSRLEFDALISSFEDWLFGETKFFEIRGLTSTET